MRAASPSTVGTMTSSMLIISILYTLRLSLVVQRVKRLPEMWEIRVQSPDQEDPLEKEMASHSSTLGWKIPWMEEPGKLQSLGLQRIRHD